jgi:hypothetical protein
VKSVLPKLFIGSSGCEALRKTLGRSRQWTFNEVIGFEDIRREGEVVQGGAD